MRLILKNTAETYAAGAACAEQLLNQSFSNAWIIFLEGDLGTGKTTWAQGFLKRLGYSGRVKSPSYSLVEYYDPVDLLWEIPVFHFDFYRLSDDLQKLDRQQETEIFADIGLWEAIAHPVICLIEWPSRIREGLLTPDQVIQFSDDPESGGRRMVVSP